MRKYLEKMIRFFCRNKSIVLSCCIAILVGMVVLNGTVSYAEDTYGIYGVIRKSIEKNEVSSIGSKDSLNDYVAENSNGTQAVTGNSIDVSKDEKYKGPKHKGIGQNVVLSGGLSVKKSQETAKVDFFTKDSNNKKVDEDKNIVVEGSVSASKREQKDNVLSKSDCMDVSDTLSKNNIEGISKDSDNYEIVSGTVPTVSEITKDNITKASFYQRAVAIGEKSNSNYNLLNILDKDIVKDDFYTSDLLKDNSSETFDFDFLDEPGLPSTGSAVSAADGNKEFDMEIAKSADILPASASAVKFSNKNQLNINLTPAPPSGVSRCWKSSARWSSSACSARSCSRDSARPSPGIRICGKSERRTCRPNWLSSASGKSLREPPIFPNHLSKTALPSHSRRRMARRQPSAAKIPETSCSSTAKYSSRTWPHAVSPRTGPAPPTSASC